MILITDHLSALDPTKRKIALHVDRRKLAKRRWRGQASDGADFGFDLAHPFSHDIPFHETDDIVYVIEQDPEVVFKIPFHDARTGALYGWMVGNMHFTADFREDAILVENDPAIRQMLERNQIAFEETTTVFQPPVTTKAHQH